MVQLSNVIIKGAQELETAFKKFVFDMDKAIDDGVRVTAFKVMNTATENIRTPSAGKTVVRYPDSRDDKYTRRSSVVHIQSAEGDAPNTDTGRLIGSIVVDHVKGSQVAHVGTNLDYGAILETERNRPWLEPAKDAEIKFFKNNIAAAMDGQIKKVDK